MCSMFRLEMKLMIYLNLQYMCDYNNWDKKVYFLILRIQILKYLLKDLRIKSIIYIYIGKGLKNWVNHIYLIC